MLRTHKQFIGRKDDLRPDTTQLALWRGRGCW